MSSLALTSLVDKTLIGQHASDVCTPRSQSSRRRSSSPAHSYAWHSDEQYYSKWKKTVSGAPCNTMAEVLSDGPRPIGDVENQKRIMTLVGVDHRSSLIHRVIKEVLLVALFLGIAIRFGYWVLW